MKKKTYHILVIPDLFPATKNDLRGIFILDYIDSVKNSFEITVFASKLTSVKTGYSVEQNDNYVVHRFALLKSIRLKALKPVFYLIWFYRSYSILKKLKDVDLVHSHGTILSGTLGWLFSKRKKIPFIITEHQNPFSMITDNFLKFIWARYILQKADIVLTVSNHLKSEILNTGIKPREIKVTYNPVNADIFNLTQSAPVKIHTFVFAGRLDAYKGALRCVNAFSQIVKSYNNWNFIIIGEGEEFDLIKEFLNRDEELKNRIIMKGYLKKDELAAIFKTADFFIFPSLHESFGLVIAEAMACGLPVIAPNITAPPEYVDETSGILVNPADIDEISRAIEHMINHYLDYNREEISRKTIEKFGLKEFGREMESAYSSVLTRI